MNVTNTFITNKSLVKLTSVESEIENKYVGSNNINDMFSRI